jgi:sugar phosphate isomerase/epimerase
MKRREFIQASAVTAASLISLPTFLMAGKGKNAVGLQIYTLRDTVMKDPKGVLQKVASFGYKELEAFAYGDGKIFGMPYSEFGSFTKGLGMQVVSGHYPLDMARGDKWQQAIDDAKAIGQEYMVVPWINEPERKTIDSYKSICASLNKAGEMCNKSGIRFGYHNHAFEFETVEGQTPYEVMLKELDPKMVGMELDIYWVYRAGKDALQLFQANPGRFEQWHVKDMDKNDKDKNADVGTGSIDWKAIFAKAKESGMKHFYVEQESYPGEPINSVEASIKNLKKII